MANIGWPYPYPGIKPKEVCRTCGKCPDCGNVCKTYYDTNTLDYIFSFDHSNSVVFIKDWNAKIDEKIASLERSKLPLDDE